jgi:hypothetical protein
VSRPVGYHLIIHDIHIYIGAIVWNNSFPSCFSLYHLSMIENGGSVHVSLDHFLKHHRAPFFVVAGWSDLTKHNINLSLFLFSKTYVSRKVPCSFSLVVLCIIIASCKKGNDNINLFIFLDCFKLKIIFFKKKKYFNIFLNKKILYKTTTIALWNILFTRNSSLSCWNRAYDNFSCWFRKTRTTSKYTLKWSCFEI